MRIARRLYRTAPLPAAACGGYVFCTDRDPPAKWERTSRPDAAQDCPTKAPRAAHRGQGKSGRPPMKRSNKIVLAALAVLATAAPLSAMAAPPKAKAHAQRTHEEYATGAITSVSAQEVKLSRRARPSSSRPACKTASYKAGDKVSVRFTMKNGAQNWPTRSWRRTSSRAFRELPPRDTWRAGSSAPPYFLRACRAAPAAIGLRYLRGSAHGRGVGRQAVQVDLAAKPKLVTGVPDGMLAQTIMLCEHRRIFPTSPARARKSASASPPARRWRASARW